MSSESVKGYLGSVVEKTGGLFMSDGGEENNRKSTTSSIISFLTKTAVMGGIIAGSYYLGRDSTKPNGVVSKMLGKKPVNKAKVDGCVLHCYDHCPFSIKVELVLAFLGVPYTRVLYGFGDEEGPKSLPVKGKKEFPILKYMGSNYISDSQKIIDMLEFNTVHRSIPPKTDRKDIEEWLIGLGADRETLCRPRMIKMPVKDWADNRDIRYAKKKWGSMKDSSGRTAKLLAKVNESLEQFNDKILFDEHSVNEFGFGMDDILLLPDLRTLTCIKGIKWPRKVRKYLENAFEDTHADLYFKHAVE